MVYDIYEALRKSGMNVTEALTTLAELADIKNLNKKIKDFVREQAEEESHCPKCLEETEYDEYKDYLDDSGIPEIRGYRQCPYCGWRNDE